jgi:hypothetical protein
MNTFWITIALLLVAPRSALAVERNTREEAIEFMRLAQQYVKDNGIERATEEFNNANSPFNRKSEINRKGLMGVASTDSHGFQAIHGINPKIRGKNMYDMRDMDGTPFVRHFVATCFATKAGRGWVKYKFPNPDNGGKIEWKSAYVDRVPNSDLCLITWIHEPLEGN